MNTKMLQPRKLVVLVSLFLLLCCKGNRIENNKQPLIDVPENSIEKLDTVQLLTSVQKDIKILLDTQTENNLDTEFFGDCIYGYLNKKEKENDMDSFEQIKSASLNDEVYVVVDTFNLTGKNIELKLLDKEGIITDSAYGQVNFLQDGKDVNGTYKSKVDKFNNEKENEYALFSIHLKGKDEATTADWIKKINSSKDKKLNLCLEVNVTDEEDVVYCGVNDGSTSENNRWLDEEEIPVLEKEYFGIVIHHSGNSGLNAMTQIQNEHMDENERADIGYHFGISLSE